MPFLYYASHCKGNLKNGPHVTVSGFKFKTKMNTRNKEKRYMTLSRHQYIYQTNLCFRSCISRISKKKKKIKMVVQAPHLLTIILIFFFDILLMQLPIFQSTYK